MIRMMSSSDKLTVNYSIEKRSIGDLAKVLLVIYC